MARKKSVLMLPDGRLKYDVCSVHKCDNAVTRNRRTRMYKNGNGLCEKHYCRIRRNGSTDLIEKAIVKKKNGYLMIKENGHPLANKHGWLYQHRYVAYEKYGSGNQHCFWCIKGLNWPKLTIDHFNENKADNSPDNLLISCNHCNRCRGFMKGFISTICEQRINDLIRSFQYMRNPMKSTT